jgi:hypothetical protein
MTVKGQQATEDETKAFFIVLDTLKKLKPETIRDYPQGCTVVIMDELRAKFNIQLKKKRKK